MTQPATTSGTYNFSPSLGEAVLYAFALAGVEHTELTQQHFFNARMASNLITGRWSADGVNLWQVDLQCIQLVQGCNTYSVPSNTIALLDGYYTIGNGTSATTDRIMMPISRSEYATYPNKQQQGAPTVYWFDRLLSPTVTLWATPDGTQSSFKYYRLRQTQDSIFDNATSIEIPVYFLEAFCFALAARMAMIYAPEKAVGLKAMADEAWGIASKQNTETANMYVAPMLGQYYRR